MGFRVARGQVCGDFVGAAELWEEFRLRSFRVSGVG